MVYILTIKPCLLRLASNSHDTPPPPLQCAYFLTVIIPTRESLFLLCWNRQENYRKWRVGKDMTGDCRYLFQCSISGKIYENHENLSQDSSWGRVQRKMDSVARKLSTTEERGQDQSCLLRWGDYRNNGNNSVKSLSMCKRVNICRISPQ
jgi:hypothetical protein